MTARRGRRPSLGAARARHVKVPMPDELLARVDAFAAEQHRDPRTGEPNRAAAVRDLVERGLVDYVSPEDAEEADAAGVTVPELPYSGSCTRCGAEIRATRGVLVTCPSCGQPVELRQGS